MGKFNNGDIVQLQSGGMAMTVATVLSLDETVENRKEAFNAYKEMYPEDDAFYLCTWFNENNELKRDIFPESVLKKA